MAGLWRGTRPGAPGHFSSRRKCGPVFRSTFKPHLQGSRYFLRRSGQLSSTDLAEMLSTAGAFPESLTCKPVSGQVWGPEASTLADS